MSATKEHRKVVESNLKKDPDYYKKLGSLGGKKSTYRPMRDVEYARQLGHLSWSKRRKRPLLECKICSLSFMSLNVHIRHKHGLSVDEYREKTSSL